MTIDILDSEELFFLGIRASENNDHEKALIYFKKSVGLDKNPRNVYMLGAEYAELGMFDRAYTTMQEAVGLEPQLWDAHFQSGLVKFVIGDVNAAESAWQSLDQLPPDSALVLFKRGILAFSSGNKVDGESLLNQGVSSNTTNPALNQVISSLMEKLLEMEFTSPSEGDVNQMTTADEGDDHDKMNRLFMQAYKSKTRQ
ncbi:tetratricopeptide repeat protein [Hahella sp. CCB-MM4]|uniref:tetratricopeptide repeat protein n=1 Tax=Hahella sp. (strain CCB-MM4) TaxID=1926491 RepID=UPI00143CD385|nr:hypothetical protein [Hahella sp. CCB-MM4]